MACPNQGILNQSITAAGIHRIAVTRQPETRIYAVLDDGTVAVYTVDRTEEVAGWTRLEMADDIKDVVALPGADEDGDSGSIGGCGAGCSVYYQGGAGCWRAPDNSNQ